PADPGRLRIVVFLTDGYVGNEDEVLALVQEHLGEARLFSFGVGSAVNRYLLEELGAGGGGTAQIVRGGGDGEAAGRGSPGRVGGGRGGGGAGGGDRREGGVDRRGRRRFDAGARARSVRRAAAGGGRPLPAPGIRKGGRARQARRPRRDAAGQGRLQRGWLHG